MFLRIWRNVEVGIEERGLKTGAVIVDALEHAHIGEGTVAFVVIQHVGVILGAPGHDLGVIADVEIQPPIAVVIAPHGSRALAEIPDPGVSGDIGERERAVVAQQDVRLALGRQIDVPIGSLDSSRVVVRGCGVSWRRCGGESRGAGREEGEP